MDHLGLVCDLFENAPTGLAILDGHGSMKNVNRWFCEVLGYELDELLDRKIFEFARDPELESSEVQKLLTGQGTCADRPYLKKSGQEIRISLRGSILQNRKETCCLISAVEVSEEYLAKEALRKSETRFRMAERATNDAIWEWNLRNNTVSWNRGVETLMGYRPQDIEPNSSWWIGKIHPEDRERVLKSLDEALKRHSDFWTTEFRIQCGDGQYLTVMEKACIEFDSKDFPLRIIGSKRDISSMRKYQQELEQAREEALRAVEAKSAFLANISHEIRTPLSAILGFTDFLLDPEITSEQRHEYLLTIQRNGQILSHLVDEILDLSKLEFHSMEVERIYFNLQDVLEHVNSVLKIKAQQKGVELRFQTASSVPEYVRTDPTRFQQILLNVVGNAVKFTEKGRVEVRIECVQAKSPQDEMILRCIVEDTGIGMNLLEQSRLFQQFTQADSTTTRRFGGTGLGLFLSRGLAHALGGDVRLLESRPQVGSTFEITLAAGFLDEAQKAKEAFRSSSKTSQSSVESVQYH